MQVVAELSQKQIAKQEAILAAALQLFASKGFHGTAVPDVATLANVGTGTIYRYFASKEALVNAVYQRAKYMLRDALDHEGFAEELDTRERFHLFWQRLIQFARAYPLEFRFLELQDHVPYLDQQSKKIELDLLLPVWAYCVMACKQNIARQMPAEALMALIWGACVGLMKSAYMGYITLDDEILAEAELACWASFSRS